MDQVRKSHSPSLYDPVSIAKPVVLVLAKSDCDACCSRVKVAYEILKRIDMEAAIIIKIMWRRGAMHHFFPQPPVLFKVYLGELLFKYLIHNQLQGRINGHSSL